MGWARGLTGGAPDSAGPGGACVVAPFHKNTNLNRPPSLPMHIPFNKQEAAEDMEHGASKTANKARSAGKQARRARARARAKHVAVRA